MNAVRPISLICMTPVKNEAWILDRFLQCAGTWADHIVVADQQSDDGSRAIARAYESVVFIDNPSEEYDEQARQKLLLDTARELPAAGKRILFALDADEMLTANWRTSPDWTRVLEADPGTVLWLKWVNVAPDMQRGWIPEQYIPFGYVDDGAAHRGAKIHSPRVPVAPDAKGLYLDDIRVLHYQYTNWERMKSKQRWYQCWERIEHPEKRPVTLFRQYHHMDAAVLAAEPLKPEWTAAYEQAGIDMRRVETAEAYTWDHDLVALLHRHGAETFRKLNIWDVDWTHLSRAMGYATNGSLQDPRNAFDRAVHAWLSRTQARHSALRVRAVQKALQLAGW